MSTKELIKQADEAYYQARYEIAIELYQKVLEVSPKNKHAQVQLRKAEFKLSLKAPFPNIPAEAQELYRRSRSFIRAGDMRQAKKLLKEAILAAEKNNINFIQAQQLLDHLPDARTAEGYKEKALKQLDINQWAGAAENLKTAVDLDPTDETIQTLLSHLEGLIIAQGNVSRLQVGNLNRSAERRAIAEVQKTIDMTKESTGLSALWQEVVNQFGKFDNVERNRNLTFRNLLWSFLGATILVMGIVWVLYILPRTEAIVSCPSIEGINIHANYPNYVANGDNETIILTIKNSGDESFDGQIIIGFQGNTKIQFENKGTNKVEIENLVRAEQKTVKIDFIVDDPFSLISNPGHFIEFNLYAESNGNRCASEDFHIATSPIYGLQKIIGFLWGSVGITLITLLWDRIKVVLGLSK